MKFYIKKLYIWFDRDVKPRTLEFENNKVNVVTGSSSTGKSNIYAIIDYCLLSGNVNIVFPVINENAQWYGLEFSVNGTLFAIARKKPTVETIPSDVYIQNEIFSSDYYPSNTNAHVNDARKQLNKAFGYHNNQDMLYRTSFVFNALTESIITSPYDFLNFKFFGDEKYDSKDERKNLLQFVLTPRMEEYANLKIELDSLRAKKKSAEGYQSKVTNANDNFYKLLNDLIKKCVKANLSDSSILSQDSTTKLEFIEGLFNEMSSEKMQSSQLDNKLKSLQQDHFKKTIQLQNIERAQEEYNGYYQTLNQIEDSLKPITFIEQHLDIIGSNMWTSHIINSLKQSLSKVAENKQDIQQRPLVSLSLISSLKKQIADIDDQIGEITKQKGSLYKQVEALKVIGQIEASISQLRDYKTKKDKTDGKPEKTFTPEENSHMKVLEQKLENLDQKKASIINDLNQCIQVIYDGLSYMEHYDNCYTKYSLNQERLMLNDGKSIINYDVIGSQSNYMFLHLCFFLGLHRYFFENVTSQVGQFLFIDQPSIPYYAGSENVKTTDREKLLDAFKTINTFMEYVIEEKQEEFQIILIEHAPESYWTGNNKLDHFITKATFTGGDALIPEYVLNK
ncbi:MAG: DUF3732 domain-containing protein [Dysgonomonas sp.]|nr:DUF3732 domain-containing protein [Dysgonomonas sp.]